VLAEVFKAFRDNILRAPLMKKPKNFLSFHPDLENLKPAKTRHKRLNHKTSQNNYSNGVIKVNV